MAKATYTGPGSAIQVDGMTIKQGETVELDASQIARIRQDPDAELQVEDAEDSPEIRDRIREQQDAARDAAASETATKTAPKRAKRKES